MYVREGTLQKMCRKGLRPRHFFLFNDVLVSSCSFCLDELRSPCRVPTGPWQRVAHGPLVVAHRCQVYGKIISKSKYANQHTLALCDVTIEDVADDSLAPYGFQVSCPSPLSTPVYSSALENWSHAL